jgi:hypothetical protein
MGLTRTPNVPASGRGVGVSSGGAVAASIEASSGLAWPSRFNPRACWSPRGRPGGCRRGRSTDQGRGRGASE